MPKQRLASKRKRLQKGAPRERSMSERGDRGDKKQRETQFQVRYIFFHAIIPLAEIQGLAPGRKSG